MKPNQRIEVVGKKSAMQLLAESAMRRAARGDALLGVGAFTAQDFAKETGWTVERAKNHLKKLGLKSEVAQDMRQYRNPMVRFYFPTNNPAKSRP